MQEKCVGTSVDVGRESLLVSPQFSFVEKYFPWVLFSFPNAIRVLTLRMCMRKNTAMYRITMLQCASLALQHWLK